MKIRKTDAWTMAEVRLQDRRIKVYRFNDKSWGVSFVRPAKACSGCKTPAVIEHQVFMDPKRRRMVTGLRMSQEAMTGLMNAVLTLIELEKGGVNVAGGGPK
jgi:hypothetical protein